MSRSGFPYQPGVCGGEGNRVGREDRVIYLLPDDDTGQLADTRAWPTGKRSLFNTPTGGTLKCMSSPIASANRD